MEKDSENWKGPCHSNAASNMHVAAVCHGDGHHGSQTETCSSNNKMGLRHASKCTHKGPRGQLQTHLEDKGSLGL